MMTQVIAGKSFSVESNDKMTAKTNPLAGKPAPPSLLVNVPRLVAAYYCNMPDPSIPSQRVSFGTSGHRGSASNCTFNEAHVLAIAQAICLYRQRGGIDGPLFVGMDTHALSEPAFARALEVFAANGVETMIAGEDGYTPTPVISQAILTYNKGRRNGLADGIVISPSHNPPDDGGFKYNPANGGPADIDITGWIETTANDFLQRKLGGVRRIPPKRAQKEPCVHAYDYMTPYVSDLANIVDMDCIRASGIRIGIDPLGGAAVHYWAPITERYKIAASMVNDAVDPTFRFMTVDWDGKIRMDCSSPYAMERLVGLREKFDIAFANDTDADRHGIGVVGEGDIEFLAQTDQPFHRIGRGAIHSDLSVPIDGHESKRRIDGVVHHGRRDLVTLADGRPIMHGSAAQRIDSDPDAACANLLHIDNIGEVDHIGHDVIVSMNAGCLARTFQGNATYTVQLPFEEIVRSRFDPAGDIDIGRSAIRRIVFETTIVRRIVRRGDDDAVGQSVPTPLVVGQYCM